MRAPPAPPSPKSPPTSTSTRSCRHAERQQRQPDHEGPARIPGRGLLHQPHSRSQRDAKLLILDDVQPPVRPRPSGRALRRPGRPGPASVGTTPSLVGAPPPRCSPPALPLRGSPFLAQGLACRFRRPGQLACPLRRTRFCDNRGVAAWTRPQSWSAARPGRGRWANCGPRSSACRNICQWWCTPRRSQIGRALTPRYWSTSGSASRRAGCGCRVTRSIWSPPSWCSTVGAGSDRVERGARREGPSLPDSPYLGRTRESGRAAKHEEVAATLLACPRAWCSPAAARRSTPTGSTSRSRPAGVR